MDEDLAQRYLKLFGNQEIEAFKITSLLGFGKSAAVFSGENATNEKVAIKIFDREMSSKYGSGVQQSRIENEISLVGHKIPNLVSIFAGGTTSVESDEYFYIIMEFFEGITLSQFIKQNDGRGQTEQFVKNVLNTLLETSDKLLQLNIVHRDIKPDNIMIDKQNNLKLMDLGVIKLINSPNVTDQTGSKPFIGTLRYAPPEFLFRKELDEKDNWRAIDLYQIGGVLHDLIMGQELFHQYSEPYAALVKAIEVEVPYIFRSDYNKEFSQLVRNLLHKDWKTRLDLFTNTDLEKILSLPEVNLEELSNSRKETIELKDAVKQKLNAIDKIKEAERLKQQLMDQLLNDVLQNINGQLTKLKEDNEIDTFHLIAWKPLSYLSSAYLSPYGSQYKIPLLKLKPNTNSKALIYYLAYELKGSLKQLFVRYKNLYLVFILEIQDENTVSVNVIGLISYINTSNDKDQQLLEVLKYASTYKEIHQIIHGIYNKTAFEQTLAKMLVKFVDQYIKIMRPELEKEINNMKSPNFMRIQSRFISSPGQPALYHIIDTLD